jgi:hypothetical protein
MNKLNSGFLFAVCMMILLISPLRGRAEKTRVKVVVNIANVRLKPDLGSQVIDKMPLGTILESDEIVGEWFKVNLPPDESGISVTGYMHKSVVQIIAEEPVEKKKVEEEEKEEEKEKEMAEEIKKPKIPAKQPLKDTKIRSSKVNKLKIGVQGGAGFTIVDLAKASGYDEPILTEWGTFHYKFNLQALYRLGMIELGLEVGYNDLYWYYLRIPYGYQTIYRENYVHTVNIYGLLQHTMPNAIFLQGGAGIHIFGDGSVLGLMGEVGYDIQLSERLSIPLFLRFDVIFGDGTPMPISLGGGIRYHMPGF